MPTGRKAGYRVDLPHHNPSGHTACVPLERLTSFANDCDNPLNMPTQNVNLTSQQSSFVKRGVKTGRYQNVSEVVRAGLRLLEQREREDQAKLRNLRRLVNEGLSDIDSNRFELITPENLDQFVQSVSAKSRRAQK
ncbi:type II toxin-antitoxin system ParD family antitoxin [Humisphaera borealis]|uniref:Type II toxin-antitoxin system ParD family antitoxin n=1 Tax=Humisphaera borealis TaxID=2807512 RepID=A0A7M2WTV3_9BACT|nr:type II toxin-antitoxin system ParD family antitoxin [Humisphaera borealis]QOV88955.1 type II toxin-antitoxin system ParD family antitoxin [Humisphaera borealis]